MMTVSQTGTAMTIALKGRFDFRCVKAFQEALTNQRREWVVDFDQVDYIDSAGLGMLLLLREHAGGDAATISLRHVRGQPRDVLRMAKFERMFSIES